MLRGSEGLSKAKELPLEGRPGLRRLRERPGEDRRRARASSGHRTLGEAAAPAVVRGVYRPRRGLLAEHVQGGVLGKHLLQRLEGILHGLVLLVFGEMRMLLGIRLEEPVVFLELRDELLNEIRKVL